MAIDRLLKEDGVSIDPARPNVLVMTEAIAHRCLAGILADDATLIRLDGRGIDSYRIEGYPAVVEYTG